MKKTLNIWKKIYLILISTALLLTSFTINTINADTIEVDSWATFSSAISNANDGDVIKLNADFVMPYNESIPIDKDITITADNEATIKREFPGAGQVTTSMFKIVTNGKLTLSGKVILSGDGANNNYTKNKIDANTRGFFIEVGDGGSLVIDGATIKDFKTRVCNDTTRDNLPKSISPIYVVGNFEMIDGLISGNRVSSVGKDAYLTGPDGCAEDGYNANDYIYKNGVHSHRVNSWDNVKWLSTDSDNHNDGGALFLTSGAIYFDGNKDSKYSISGGEIKNNNGNAGAIIVNKGTLDIKNDTKISNNFGDHTSTVFVAGNDATVRMCGGTINDNTAAMGGGVLAGYDGNFFLMGGTIDNNYSTTCGGGILVYSNNVYILAGKIINNKSAIFGGGIYVYGNDSVLDRSQSYTIVISKADIKNNTAVYTPNHKPTTDSELLGIYTADNSHINVVGDEQFQRGSGGGIWLCPAGISTFDGTSVNLSNNAAERQNADFHKDAGFAGGLLVDFGPHENLKDWVHDEYGSSPNPFTLEEATSGMLEMFGIKNINPVDHNKNVWVEITGNASRRGGGVGSNGTVLFMTPNKDDINIDNGLLSYQKTFVDMPEEKMEYDMILADENGEAILNDAGEEINIATFRLFDADFEANYETNRKDKNSDLYGQGAATWSTDLSKIDIEFPKGNDAANYFNTDDGDNSELHIIIREYRVQADDSRGEEVSERVFKSSDPVLKEVKVKDEQHLTYFNSFQPCSIGGNCSCDPGEPNTFYLRIRTFNFDANGVNKETPEIEKYVEQAVHKDIKLEDEFTYNILAYVTTDADEVVVTDELNNALEFVSKAKDVKVYDLGTTTDKNTGKQVPVQSNHLPVYDVSGNAIDNGNKVPSVTAGNQINIKNNEYSKVEINGNTLTVKLANKLKDDGSRDTSNQELDDLYGHYIRIEFKAKLSKSLLNDINSGNKTIDDLKADYENIKVNDPVKSKEEHSGILNRASYEIKVGNTAKYQDTSNDVTVKLIDYIDIDVNKTWDDMDDLDGNRPSKVQVNLLADGKIVQTATITEKDNWTYTFKNLEKGPKYTIEEEVVEYCAAEIIGNEEDDFEIINHYRSYLPKKRRLTSEETGEFTLTKTADKDVSKDIEFSFKVKMLIEDDENGNTRTYEEVVKLKVGESKYYDFVADGTEIEIVELNANEYEVTYYLDEATITKGFFIMKKESNQTLKFHNKTKKPYVPPTGAK